jgi:hypothetical protein
VNENSSRPEAVTDLPAHYLYRGPSGLLGILSIVFALVVLAYTISEVRRSADNQPAISIITGGTASKDLPVLTVSDSDWHLNGQPVSAGDVVFRLSGLAAKSPGIVLDYAPGVPGDRLTQALDFANRAGFSQVGLRALSADSSTTGTSQKE